MFIELFYSMHVQQQEPSLVDRKPINANAWLRVNRGFQLAGLIFFFQV